MAGESALAKSILGAERVAPSLAKVGTHPLIKSAAADLAKIGDPAAYNAALEGHVNRISGDFPMQIPGMKGSFNLGPRAGKIYFRNPDGSVGSVFRSAAEQDPSIIPQGATILNKSQDELRTMLGGRKEVPEEWHQSVAEAQATDAAAARQQAEAQSLADIQGRDVAAQRTPPIDPARRRFASTEEAMTSEAETAAQQEAEAARRSAALEGERAQGRAQAWQDEQRRIANISAAEDRARQAGVGTSTVDLRALLGEGASPMPPAVQLAKETVSAPRAVPISEAAPAAEAAASPFRPGARGGPWSPPSSSVPSSGLAPANSIEEAVRAAEADRRAVNAIQLGIATPFAVAAGAKTFTPERIERFRNFMNSPTFTPTPADQNEQYTTPEDRDRAVQIAKQRAAASTETPTATTTPAASAPTSAPVSQNPFAISGYETSDQNVSAPIPGGAPPAAARPAAPSAARASAPVSRDAPLPPRRPAEFASEQGNQSLLSSIFSRLKTQDPYAGMSARDMYEKAQEMQRSGDDTGANILIQRAGQAPDAGMKSGGTAGSGGQKAAGPHKDAALHKALDIIHAMLTRR